MAKAGHYKVLVSHHPDLEVVRAVGLHPCWGATIERDGEWVLTRSVECGGTIKAKEFYVVCRILPPTFQLVARISGQRWTMCTPCAVRYYGEHLTGAYVDYLRGPVSAEEVASAITNLKETVVALIGHPASRKEDVGNVKDESSGVDLRSA